jgi:hypothetical protein
MHYGLFQENIPDTRTIASSLLPVVTPGTARVARDIISQLMSLFSGGEQTRRGAPGGCNSWTCPSTKQQPEIPQFQRRLSLDTFFPVDSSAKSPPSRPLSLHLPSDVMRMDTGDIVVTVAGSNEARVCEEKASLLKIYVVNNWFSRSKTLKMAIFWVVATCSLVEVCRRFRGPCCLVALIWRQQGHLKNW